MKIVYEIARITDKGEEASLGLYERESAAVDAFLLMTGGIPCKGVKLAYSNEIRRTSLLGYQMVLVLRTRPIEDA